MSLPLDSDLAALARELSRQLGPLIEAAEASVVEWRWAESTPLPHRLEPYLHERVWIPRGRFVDAPADERYGFDADGEVTLVRADAGVFAAMQKWSLGPGRYDVGELVLRAPSTVVTAVFSEELPDGGRTRLSTVRRHTLVDGRIVRTEYHGTTMDHEKHGEEHYVYDGDRLVAIEEFDGVIWSTRESGSREFLVDRGRVSVRDGELRAEDGRCLWRPSDVPFPQRLEAAAREHAQSVAAVLAGWADPDRPVDALWLDNYTQDDIHAVLYVGSPGRPDPFWFFDGPDHYFEFDDEENTLLREAALAGPEPVERVTDAIARELLAYDWTGIIAPTDDFVVYAAEVDHRADQERALRRVNPPATVERWLRRS